MVLNAPNKLTLCIRETPKPVLLQTMKTHMKAAFHQGLHCKGKIDLQTKENNIFLRNALAISTNILAAYSLTKTEVH